MKLIMPFCLHYFGSADFQFLKKVAYENLMPLFLSVVREIVADKRKFCCKKEDLRMCLMVAAGRSFNGGIWIDS